MARNIYFGEGIKAWVTVCLSIDWFVGHHKKDNHRKFAEYQPNLYPQLKLETN